MARAISRHGMVRARVPLSETLWFSPALCGLGAQAAPFPASAPMFHSHFVEVYSVHLVRSHISFKNVNAKAQGVMTKIL